MSVPVPVLFRWLVRAAVGGLLLLPAGAAAGAPANLIENGGFEEWADLDPNTAGREDVRNLELSPPNRGPAGWTPLREILRGQERTASLAMDERVKHSGARSVRIENRDRRDIALLHTSTERFAGRPADTRNVRPNRRYLLRWWVKGENVESSGAGPLLMMYVTSEKEGKRTRTDDYEKGVALPQGTFDWQQRQFVFITDEHARSATFTLQLRWSTGTVWYDDVEMLDLGPVVPVETYCAREDLSADFADFADWRFHNLRNLRHLRIDPPGRRLPPHYGELSYSFRSVLIAPLACIHFTCPSRKQTFTPALCRSLQFALGSIKPVSRRRAPGIGCQRPAMGCTPGGARHQTTLPGPRPCLVAFGREGAALGDGKHCYCRPGGRCPAN